MKKLATGGDGCNANMDIEYQNAIAKKKQSGITEGKAILDWLSENEKANKAKTQKEAQTRSNILRSGRPNEKI